MRAESLIIGLVILGLGIYLVSSGGVIAGVNLPHLIGLPSCSSGTNSTCGGTAEFGGFGIGTIVAIFGLGMIARGLRTPSTPRMSASAAAGPTAPYPTSPGIPGRQAGVRYCSACGGANQNDATYCQHCAEPMRPPIPPAGLSPVPPAAPPQSGAGTG